MTCRSRLCDLYCVSTTTLQVAGVHDVGQREVDQPVDAAERHRRLGPVGRQRHQPLALAAREDDRQDLRVRRCGRHERPPYVGIARHRRERAPRRLVSVCVRVDILSKEYPPEIYGGAGVHVAELGPGAARPRRPRRAGPLPSASPATRRAPRRTPTSPSWPSQRRPADPGVDLAHRPGRATGADLVHSHTWYANLAGHLASLLSAASRTSSPPTASSRCGRGRPSSSAAATPLVLGREDGLRGGRRRHRRQRRHARRTSCAATRRSTRTRSGRAQRHRLPACGSRDADEDVVRRHGVDPDRPSVIFVGRITRQKGLPYLLRAAAQLPPEVQLVLCAGAPDTPEIKAEVEGLIDELRSHRDGVVWIPEMLPRARSSRCSPRDGVRLPVGLRAARHRQPRGDGLRAAGRRHRDRRHPRGRRARRDRLAGPDRAGAPTAPAPRWTRSASSPTSPPPSTTP